MDDGYLRIGEFSERVGVSPDLLRAWERRYGLLQPDRSSGGFRLYSDADVARVERMTALVGDGLSAAEAARLALVAREPVGEPPAADAADLSLETSRARLARALGDFDEQAAHRVIDELLASFNLETVLQEVVLPYLSWVGEKWAQGELSVGQEHFASIVLRGRLLGLARGWSVGVGPTALLASPPGEEHDLALVTFGLSLWRRGWRITFLGADTPISAISDAVRTLGPDVVVLAAVRSEPFLAIEDALAALSAEVPVLIGGQGASAQFAAAIGADHLDVDPVAAAERVAARHGAGSPPVP